MLTRTMGAFAGPVGWVLSSLWLLIDLAGPAYRVTLPSCILLPTCARSIFIHQRMLTFSTYISNFRALKLQRADKSCPLLLASFPGKIQE